MAQNDKNSLSLHEIQQLELEVMKDFHSWCEQHNLRYALTYGTLIGAVRHQGFIPWDNDMDIMMPRPDFEKMLKICETDSVSPTVKILHYSKDNKYHYQVARACSTKATVVLPYLNEQPDNLGVWVDIFPLDGVPGNPDEIQNQLSLASKFYKLMLKVDLYSSKEIPVRGFITSVIRFFIPNKNNKHMRKIDQYAMLCDFDNSEYVADMIEPKPIPLPRDDFNNLQLPKYEDTEFYIPPHWDDYLSKAYGDYMKLPPEGQREVHGIQAFWN